ncbi:MAG: hypothetical protein M0Z65_16195 [Firmicutes bacterium]|uniref:Uncharacterized protein n=1 Tax=Melghirimyces thermohalophilus TaxID=1236220 RepID=A0A1G6L7S0_9BACL|nr:hypothetical protein [Melghirimyces thermohalophilus]MDA8354685.1 hypothetical protein [Bacillota bacterium]SDC39402.1 hypothetical protein SAMN04488112_10798 [Melghirimyces thermohalophilus]
MKRVCQSSSLSDDLAETEEVEVSHPLIQQKAKELSRAPND